MERLLEEERIRKEEEDRLLALKAAEEEKARELERQKELEEGLAKQAEMEEELHRKSSFVPVSAFSRLLQEMSAGETVKGKKTRMNRVDEEPEIVGKMSSRLKAFRFTSGKNDLVIYICRLTLYV